MDNLLLIEHQKNVPGFLLYEYMKIGLTENEAFLLLQLFPLSRNFNIEKYAEQLNTPAFVLLEDIALLQKKGFLEINMYELDGKYAEELSFLPLIKKYVNKDDKKEENITKEIASIVEKTFARTINHNEIEYIKKWVFIDNIELSDITNAINLAHLNNVKNLSYVDKILKNSKNEEEMIEIDLF